MVNIKVLINDGMDKGGLELFEKAGVETDTEKKDPKTLVEFIGDYDALTVRSATKVTRKVFEAGVRVDENNVRGKLKVVGRQGVGFDNIDLDAADDTGTIVKNAPYGNTRAAAQMAHFLMGAIARNIPQSHHTLKNGIWQKKQYTGVEFTPSTIVGILGCGRVGQTFGEYAKGLGVRVVGYDEALGFIKSQYPDSTIEYMTKKEVLEISDFVSIHVSGNELVIGPQELSLMKPSSYIINTARGGNIDEEALYEALTLRTIAGAGLDVYTIEPGEGKKFESKFRGLDNIILTPHLGASTPDAQKETSREMAEVIIGSLLYGDYTNSLNTKETVNAEGKPIYTFIVHHADVPGVFADIYAILRKHDVNIKENNSRRIGKGNAVHTTYLVHNPIPQPVIEQINVIPSVYRAVN